MSRSSRCTASSRMNNDGSVATFAASYFRRGTVIVERSRASVVMSARVWTAGRRPWHRWRTNSGEPTPATRKRSATRQRLLEDRQSPVSSRLQYNVNRTSYSSIHARSNVRSFIQRRNDVTMPRSAAEVKHVIRVSWFNVDREYFDPLGQSIQVAASSARSKRPGVSIEPLYVERAALS